MDGWTGERGKGLEEEADNMCCVGEYLQSEYDVRRCSYKLLESGLFKANKEYVRRQIVYCLLQVGGPRYLFSSFWWHFFRYCWFYELKVRSRGVVLAAIQENVGEDGSNASV